MQFYVLWEKLFKQSETVQATFLFLGNFMWRISFCGEFHKVSINSMYFRFKYTSANSQGVLTSVRSSGYSKKYVPSHLYRKSLAFCHWIATNYLQTV